MTSRPLGPASLFFFLLLGAGWLLALGPGDAVSAGSALPQRLRYGFVAQCDRPFYPVGAQARVQLALFNNTIDDAFGYSTQGGGFGCEFNVQVLDLAGNVLLTPNVACTDVIVEKPLLGGMDLRASVAVPLRDGDAILPEGHYRFRVTMEFNGPHRQAGDFQQGGDAEALIPFAIEP